MTVNDLKEVLEYYNGDMEVRFAYFISRRRPSDRVFRL